jgi:acetyl esterase/lipase
VSLHPQSVAALALWAQGPHVTDAGFGPVEVERMRDEARAQAAGETREPVERVEDVDADGVPCRLFVPAGARATLLFLHGGGFVFGDLDTHDGQARRLALRTGSAVLAVGYRRPPEHRFPAAPDDVDTALRWLRARADGLGLDPGRVAAVGDSAGGNLALVAALRNPGVLSALVLVYPFLDPTTSASSYGRDDGGLTRAEAAWYWQQYASGPEDLTSPDLAPARSARLGTVPATLVQVAGEDTLVDEGLDLVRRLEAAGARVEARAYAGMVHGFWRHPELFDASEQALADAADFLHRHV